MAYAVLADLIKRFGELELIQLTDTSNIPPSAIDAARVQTKPIACRLRSKARRLSGHGEPNRRVCPWLQPR